ncbi:hypothetical protein ACFSC4_25130 [Deinococcus malanensis]|uniref:hypothetical protein n=1 Tax=Deinococcus malanensis TaxID=1706855 RepID=UPI003630912E
MAVVGGSQYVWGGVMGSALITQLREQLRDVLPGLLGQQGSFETVVFGLLIILVLQFARRGLWPLVERVLPQEPMRLLPAGPALAGRIPRNRVPRCCVWNMPSSSSAASRRSTTCRSNCGPGKSWD